MCRRHNLGKHRLATSGPVPPGEQPQTASSVRAGAMVGVIAAGVSSADSKRMISWRMPSLAAHHCCGRRALLGARRGGRATPMG